jgi:hypothetical protein
MSGSRMKWFSITCSSSGAALERAHLEHEAIRAGRLHNRIEQRLHVGVLRLRAIGKYALHELGGHERAARDARLQREIGEARLGLRPRQRWAHRGAAMDNLAVREILAGPPPEVVSFLAMGEHRVALVVAALHRALHAGGAATAACALIEQRLGGLAPHHDVGDRVGMTFVRVACLAHAAFELNTAVLLHDVGGFVRRGV